MAFSALLVLGFVFVWIPFWLWLMIMVMLPVRLTNSGIKWYLYLLGWYRDGGYQQLERVEHTGIGDAFLTGLGRGMLTALGTPGQKEFYKQLLRRGYERGTLSQEMLDVLKAAGGIHREVVLELEAEMRFAALLREQTPENLMFVAQQLLANPQLVVDVRLGQPMANAAQESNDTNR